MAEGFKFRYLKTPVHGLDPRVKLLMTAMLFALALLSSNLYQEALVFAAVGVPAALARSLKRLLRIAALSLTFSLMIFAVNMLFGQPLLESAVITIRFLGIVAATSVFFVTTSPDEIEYVMRWFRLPRDFVFAFATSIRFVPVLMMDLTQIIDAQRSRGLEMDRGNPVRRIRNLIPVLIPLIVNALVRSGELAEAMEARGYGAVSRPTSMHALLMKKNDYAALLVLVPAWSLLITYFLGLL